MCDCHTLASMFFDLRKHDLLTWASFFLYLGQIPASAEVFCFEFSKSVSEWGKGWIKELYV